MDNGCDANHLDGDVLLPPRKRLLAGLKKQGSDCGGGGASSPSLAAASYVITPGSTSPSASVSSEFEAHLKHLLNSHSNNPNLTPEEIAEASKTMAEAATKAAEVARAVAEDKAARAAKAVTAAKSALDLVASLSEEEIIKERNLKKNKLKKHLPVQLLYRKNQPLENCRKDEELARKLHRAMNSSPRISKTSPNSDSKENKHKKSKSSSSFEINEVSDAGMAVEQDCLSLNNGHAVGAKIGYEVSIQDACLSKENKKGGRYDKYNQMEIYNGEAESSQSKERTSEDLSSIGKKRGRAKLKKLPLSICTSKDKAQPKEERRGRSSSLPDINADRDREALVNIPSFQVESSTERVIPLEATSMWKCQEFKAPTCSKQNKVVQS